MRRLAPLLAPNGEALEAAGVTAPEGWKEAWFMARFAYDQEGTVTIEIEVEANLPLVCQRSLEVYFERVSRRSLLAVVTSIAEQEVLPEHYEPVLVEQGRVALADLVEDELLLGVPQVPRNPAVEAVELSTAGVAEAPEQHEERKNRPFEKLAGLLKENTED
jgi:uncharacterized protein